MSTLLIPVSQGSPAAPGREVGGWRVLVARFPAALHLSRHAHEHPTLAAVISGGFRKQLACGDQDCRPCSVIAEPAGEHHSNLFGPRGARVVLLQPLSVPVATEPEWGMLFARPRASLDPASAEVARRIAAELETPDDLSALALDALVLELLVAALRAPRPRRNAPPPWLARIEERLRAGFIDPPGMRSLAKEAGVHPVHLARVFRSQHGTTVAGYVRRLRVAWAQEELLRPGATTVEVALGAGFADQSHFARVFLRVVGLSPGQWRRRNLA